MKEDLAFEEVARQYEPLIKGVIQQLHLYKDFEDMYQIGLIALWEAYEKFDPEQGGFGGYAKSWVKGRLMTALRSSTKYDARHVLATSRQAEEDVFSKLPDLTRILPLEKEMLAIYLKGLSGRQRLWVEEALLQGRKTKDIANDEHVSANTVRGWKKEALKKMQKNVLNLE